jgi:hypothetical protein
VAFPSFERQARLSASPAWLLPCAALLVACGTAEPHPAGTADGKDAAPSCPLVEDTDGPEVSFATDLVPFFSVTCAFGGCHDGMTREKGLYLGPNVSEGPADAATRAEVLASLLSPAETTPDLPRVTPGDPRRSFVMLKVEGCQNAMGLSCSDAVRGEPCGARMPALSPALPPDKRALLARWILEGAHGG